MRVVIIGAGVAGLSIGWRMAQAGAQVTILERGAVAQGATWASAGMIAVAGEMGEASTREAEFGRYSSGLWPDFAAEIEAESGAAVGYSRCGALIANGTSADAGLAKLTAAQARTKEPMLTPDIDGALWAPNEAMVDSRALGQALATAFARAGGTLSLNEAAVRFTLHEGKAVLLHTPFTIYEADAFIIAAGAWSRGFGGLPDGTLPPVRPVKGEMIAVAPPAGEALPTHIVWGKDIYLVPRGGRLLIGATMVEAGFDTAVTDAAADWLSARAIALMPGLARWQVVERWAGLRPASPDGAPVLGRTAVPNLFVASGQFRNGILFAPALAQSMSRLVLEHAEGIPAFDPRRFQGEMPGAAS
jgi:glycine oxidase